MKNYKLPAAYEIGALPGFRCAFCGLKRSQVRNLFNSPVDLGVSICETCLIKLTVMGLSNGIIGLRDRGDGTKGKEFYVR